MATRTASTYLHPYVMNPTSAVWAVGEYSATLSPGDIIKCGKIPHGALILDGTMYNAAAGGDLTLRLRDYSADGSSTTSAGFELCTNTGSGVTRLGGGGIVPGYQVSVSPSASIRYVDLEIVVSSATVTDVVRWCVGWTKAVPQAGEN